MEKYNTTFEIFKTWQQSNNMLSYGEKTLLAYFNEQSKKYKPSTLWSQFSMIRTVIKINEGLDIGTYPKLKEYIKTQSVGYRPNKAAVFSPEAIEKFLNEAPDEKFLDIKVMAILGILGASRSSELVNLTMDDIEYHGDVILVKLPDTKAHKRRSYTLVGEYAAIFKKYVNLRPPQATTNRFFLNFQNGKCSVQVIGRNKIAKCPYKIAEYLGLPNLSRYTGHSFRRTSATYHGDSGLSEDGNCENIL